MPKLPKLIHTLLPALLLAAGACASASPQPSTAPRAMSPAVDPLAPPASALAAADTARLTGLELGTMWTFENPPTEYWQRTYGFTPTGEWLDRVRLASVRYGEHCSASFVSPDGLVATNHHCARDCIAAVSPENVDYVVEGFNAPTRADEKVCPGLFLDQLIAIEDVTQRVHGAAAAVSGAAAKAAAQSAEQDRISAECEERTEYECQVVSLFHGGQFKLYSYRRYQPVKLVFAPEMQAGFFGGDADNFTYPRYDLDFAFVRAYAADGSTPARTPDFFRFDPDGAAEGEVVFVTGNPGSTSRQITVSQLMYERNTRHPFVVRLLSAQRELLQEMARRSPEREREIREQLFSVENSLKAYTGQLAGLLDASLLARKIRWERDFVARVNADATLRARFGDVWERIAAIQREKARVAPVRNLMDPAFYGIGSLQLQMSALLGEYLRESALPESERSEEFRGPAFQQLEMLLRSPQQLDAETGAMLLEMQLAMAREFLPADDPFLRAAFQGDETPAVASKRLIGGTRIADAAFRQEVLRGGVTAFDASLDPLIALVRVMALASDTAAARWERLVADEAVQQERLAAALFAAYGTSLPPDATFTLRISDGVVQRYPYNGTFAPPFTTYYGLFARAAEFGNEMPWQLAPRIAARRGAIAMATPLNFVSTLDITGGNSGSPIIDRDARIVGLAFDSNIEALPNHFLFRPDSPGRTVGVHSAGIIEAVRNVYQARALLDELLAAGSRR